MKVLKQYWFIYFIFMICVCAFICRAICCFWGYPIQLHPDEGTIVDKVIDMLQRHSWEAHTYDRPDHFEIKCNAIIFTIVSWIMYHKPAYEAYSEHRMTFYIMARLFTSVFGTLLVPLVTMYIGKLENEIDEQIKRIVQIAVAFLMAFSPIFVEHSAYATPDVVLCFFVILFAYGSMEYLDNGKKTYLYLCIVDIGIGVTIKYPAAILCIPLAAMIVNAP